jgi:hypothetical protein
MMVEIEMEGIAEIRAKFQTLADPVLVDQVIDQGVTDSLTKLVAFIQATATGWGRVKQTLQWGKTGPREFWVGSEDPVAGFLLMGILFGGGSILAAFMFFDKSLAEESEVKRRIWITICIIAIVGGLLCFVFAVVGLYAHQLGMI